MGEKEAKKKPLGDKRLAKFSVEVTGLEPAASRPPGVYSTN